MKFKGLLSLLLVPSMAFATVEDNSQSVPTNVSMVEYCGFTLVDYDNGLFNVEAGKNSGNQISYITLQLECPQGNYNVYFDGDRSGFDIGNAKVVFVHKGEHTSSGNKLSVAVPVSGLRIVNIPAYLVDDIYGEGVQVSTMSAPDTVVSWSGSVPIYLETQ